MELARRRLRNLPCLSGRFLSAGGEKGMSTGSNSRATQRLRILTRQHGQGAALSCRRLRNLALQGGQIRSCGGAGRAGLPRAGLVQAVPIAGSSRSWRTRRRSCPLTNQAQRAPWPSKRREGPRKKMRGAAAATGRRFRARATFCSPPRRWTCRDSPVRGRGSPGRDRGGVPRPRNTPRRFVKVPCLRGRRSRLVRERTACGSSGPELAPRLGNTVRKGMKICNGAACAHSRPQATGERDSPSRSRLVSRVPRCSLTLPWCISKPKWQPSPQNMESWPPVAEPAGGPHEASAGALRVH